MVPWALELLIIFLIILVSMILHELAHGATAYLLGDDTAKQEGRLTLNPLKHLDPVMSFLVPLMFFISGGPIFGGAKPVPINTRNLKHGAWGMALVALAGPLTNFILALVAFLIGYFTGGLKIYLDYSFYMTDLWGVICGYFVMVNLGFGIFNLLPIPPLDGSRLLYAIAPDGVRRVMESMERWGMMVVLILVVVFSGVLSMIMGGAMAAIVRFFFFLVGFR